MLFALVPSDTTKGKGHKMDHQQFQLNLRRNFFYFEGERALDHAAQGDCVVSFSGKIQILPGCNLVQSVPGKPALARGLD